MIEIKTREEMIEYLKKSKLLAVHNPSESTKKRIIIHKLPPACVGMKNLASLPGIGKNKQRYWFSTEPFEDFLSLIKTETRNYSLRACKICKPE